MNALQSYSSDENSGDECFEDKPVVRNKSSKGGGDHGTNYDDVGMDISEESSAEEESSWTNSGRTAASNGEPAHRPSMRGRATSDGREEAALNRKESSRGGDQSQEPDHNSAALRRHSLTEADEAPPDANKKDEDKQYSSLQERLLGLASGKLPDPSTVDGVLKTSSVRRVDDRRRSRSPRDRHAKSRRSRSPTRRRRSRSRDKRSKSRERKSKSREKRSRSRDRSSKSRDRRSRSRSRDRRERRRRSRSRDRRRDYKKDAAAKAGLLPLPTSAGSAPLLATPPTVPSLPAYYNPSSVNAAKYAEQERKKKLLWGNKSAAASTEGGGASACGVPGAGAAGGMGRGLLVNNHAVLLNLARANPGGRELNLGLGKNQFNVGAAKNAPAPSGASSSGGGGAAGGMADLWSSTTFSNDSDGKMAEKFKRLMGVKDGSGTQTDKSGSAGPGAKLNEVQEDMFSNMERQYEVARLATHTHKGYGLGFTSTAYLPK
ncbi:Small acidic protein-like domain [Trinorchestia longiramus]|nr:Small acidic protein-like domain [Trinorchestia longiramus]